jgi:MoxR-like ATPase
MAQVEDRVRKFKSDFDELRREVGKMIVGQEAIVEGVITCLLAEGHALLEGVPGLGKTLLVRTLSQALDLKFSRIQFTPDLMPADIVGTNILTEDESGRKSFQFQHGPVFANIILADEINRATPKTQSAMLEAMQEHSVTVAGQVRQLTEPFLVLATQNPIEMEGTYPLPEAQLDRFLFKLMVDFPTLDELGTILDRTTTSQAVEVKKVTDAETIFEMRKLAREVALADHVKDFALRTVLATHPESEHATDMVKRYVRYGSSPRGAQAIVLAGKVSALLDGRYNVSFDDIKKVAIPALRHRIILNFEGEAEGIGTDVIVRDIFEKVLAGEEVVV